MSPRPFERPALIALPDTDELPSGSTLEGLWLPARISGDAEEGSDAGLTSARGGSVMAPPHPLMGGSMDSPVATEVAPTSVTQRRQAKPLLTSGPTSLANVTVYE